MSHFYLTLPSNSSFEYFPDNTAAHFFTKLPKDVVLDGDWEVGLSEVVFPHSWFNVPPGLDIRTTCFFKDKDPPRNPYSTRLVIKEGYYADIYELVNTINETLTAPHTMIDDITEKDIPKFIYMRQTGKTAVRLPPWCRVMMPDALCYILGFDVQSGRSFLTVNNDTPHIKDIQGQRMSSLGTGLNAMYIYCDLVEYTHVGDTLAPLLRIVDVEGEHGTTIVKEYEHPRYVPVQKKNFASLEIDIRTNTGDPMPFETGPLVVTLHFRRARNSYFI